MSLKQFDVVDFLDSDEAMVEYLNAALEEQDPAFFAKAIGDVARARGMTAIAEASGVGRQSLYRGAVQRRESAPRDAVPGTGDPRLAARSYALMATVPDAHCLVMAVALRRLAHERSWR